MFKNALAIIEMQDFNLNKLDNIDCDSLILLTFISGVFYRYS